MIVKKRLTWLKLLFRFHGSSLEDTWVRILVVTGISVIITLLGTRYNLEPYSLTITPFTLIGLAISIFLGFRNNAAYDRFWEGRKLWGALVNTCRTLARQAHSLIDIEDETEELVQFRKMFVKRVIAFVHALRHHLRDSDPSPELKEFLSSEDCAQVMNARHRPLAILQQLGQDLSHARRQNWLGEVNILAIDERLVELSNIMGACERIKNTPIPFTYTVLIHRLVAFYCFFLPFGLIQMSGPLAPMVVFLISHAFFGLDAIGDEIEDPFGTLPNHLPLTTISRNIEINLLELIEDLKKPYPIKPRNGLLI